VRIMVSEKDLRQAIVDLKYREISDIVKEALAAGMPPLKILDSLKSGLNDVGELYHKREYFLSELYMAGETMEAAMNVLMPTLSKQTEPGGEGIVVIGSIQGDIHDFGKSIAKSFLTASGFRVYDLGIDVPPSKFVEEALKVNADIIGISALLSSTQPVSGEVVNLLKKCGARDKFKVILGGTAVTEWAVQAYGVDAAVNDATEGVRVMKRWMEEKRGWE
jgi:methylmalonyl-CoA mutase cobalamin-binding domain/chain